MKLRNLFLAAIVALGMMACNNEDVPAVVDGAKSTVSVKVMPSSNGAGVRASGEVVTTATGNLEESYIKTLEVYLFYGDNLEGYKSATPEVGSNTVTEVTGIETTTGPKTIVVVANASIGGDVTSKADLIAKTKDIPVDIANGLPMTGESAEIIVDPGHNQYGFATADQTTGANQIESGNPLKITRVNARVAIVKAVLELDQDEELFDGLTDVDVAIFNVPKTTKLFGAAGSLMPTSFDYLYGGTKWPTTEKSYVGYADATNPTSDFIDSKIAFPIDNTSTGKSVYYYVNENTTDNPTDVEGEEPQQKTQMLIVLRGKPYKGTPEANTPVEAEGLYTDGEGYTYYPVWVNMTGTATGADGAGNGKILRNYQYNISLTIKGIGNPTIDEVQDAWLDVAVAVEDWAVVNQNVEWN